MLVNSKNQFAISFVNDHSYCKGNLLQFSDLNASRFYFFAKKISLIGKFLIQQLLVVSIFIILEK